MLIFNHGETYLVDLNEFIHGKNKLFEYHMNHLKLVRRYAVMLNKRLGFHLNNHKLAYVSFAHDIFKERSLNPNGPDLVWKGMNIPQDLNRYVRTNLDILEVYGLDDYFNSSCQLHALAAGIFLNKELGIDDTEILYPVMFHSCPIISVYCTLPYNVRNMIDVIMLSDKLSSNYLRINMRKSHVRIDLDKVVFGESGRELNYSLGLYIARLISQGKSEEEQGKIATDFYYKRLCDSNPLIDIKKLGGNKIWPERKSQVWKMH